MLLDQQIPTSNTFVASAACFCTNANGHLEEAVETRLVVGEVDLLQEALAALLAAVRGLLVLVPEKVFKLLK